MEDKNLFVYAEGREEIVYIPGNMKRGAESCGWRFTRLKSFKMSDLTDEERALELFPENCGVVLRNLSTHNSSPETQALGRWLTKHGRVTVNFNGMGGLMAASDKQYHQMLFLNDPRTKKHIVPAHSVQSSEDVLKLVKKGLIQYPFVLKPRNGSLGKGIRAILNKDDLKTQARWTLMTAQNFIEADYDWRVYVVGGTPIGAIRRGGNEAKKYDFKARAAGINSVGERDPMILDQIGKIAASAAAVVGLEFSGVDIICDRTTGEYYILESNTSPTWIEKYNREMRVDIAAEVTKWMDERMKAKKKSKHDAMKAYVERRLNKLPRRVQRRYEMILAGKECSRVGNGKDLESRLHRCYDRLFIKGDNLMEAKCLIDEVEGMPYCWAGNFIGSATWGEDGVLEDGCIPTAYYLAIREKYDKMSKVN